MESVAFIILFKNYSDEKVIRKNFKNIKKETRAQIKRETILLI